MINTLAVALSVVALAGGLLIGVLIGVAVWASRRPPRTRTTHEHLAINVIALSQDDLLASCPHCNEIFDGPDFIHVSAVVMEHIIANHQGANHD